MKIFIRLKLTIRYNTGCIEAVENFSRALLFVVDGSSCLRLPRSRFFSQKFSSILRFVFSVFRILSLIVFVGIIRHWLRKKRCDSILTWQNSDDSMREESMRIERGSPIILSISRLKMRHRGERRYAILFVGISYSFSGGILCSRKGTRWKNGERSSYSVGSTSHPRSCPWCRWSAWLPFGNIGRGHWTFASASTAVAYCTPLTPSARSWEVTWNSVTLAFTARFLQF